MMAFVEDDSAWQQLAADAFTHLRQWRREHPKATFAEIEAATDSHLAAMRARLLRDVALTSAAATTPATCPACGAHMQARGSETRTLITNHRQAVPLTRTRAVCPACGAGLFPPR
jgi:formate dehydrogenase maturation protein FdhE